MKTPKSPAARKKRPTLKKRRVLIFLGRSCAFCSVKAIRESSVRPPDEEFICFYDGIASFEVSAIAHRFDLLIGVKSENN
jgi:hypothetical protein